ncbi:hypothetical protein, partial [Streptosporangium sp. NPDC003464]
MKPVCTGGEMVCLDDVGDQLWDTHPGGSRALGAGVLQLRAQGAQLLVAGAAQFLQLGACRVGLGAG